MKLLLAIACMVLLTACAKNQPLTGTRDRTELHVTLHWEPTPAALQKVAASYGRTVETGRLLGFSAWVKGSDQCDIYVQKPRYVDDDRTLTLGHELLHCAIGEYHP